MASCSVCGANLALVGRVHRCAPQPMANAHVVANEPKVVANVVANAVPSRHGKYADAEKRRAYMRAYMAKKRH